MAISEIVSLIWAGAGFIGISSLSIWLYRRPDAKFTLKKGDTEFSVAQSGPGTPTNLPQELGELTEQPQRQLPAPKDGEDSAAEPKRSAFARSLDLLDAGDYSAAREALQEAAREESTPEKARTTLALGYYHAASRGSLQAVDDLRALAALHPDEFEIHLWLGASQQASGDVLGAGATLNKAISLADSDSDRSLAIGVMATVVQKNDGPEPSISFLLSSARSIESRQERASLVARAAKLILESPQPNRVRAFALFEYALELTPADMSLRFDVAYAYGENSAEAASFFHYSQLLDRQPQHAGALNNLGVAASRLEMETIAVDRYRAAEELGNTLASANLAYKLLGEGFTAEAKAVLDAALKANEVHDNVLEALGAISRAKTKDDTAQKDIDKSVGTHRRLAATHGRALVEASVRHPLAGKYVAASWTLEILAASESTFTGALSSSFETRDVAGARDGNFLTFSWKTRKAEKATLLGALMMEKSGHGVLSLEPGKLIGYTFEGQATSDPTRATGYTEHSLIAEPSA